jgi:aquaporin Z
VATSKDHPNNSFYGLAIGLVVLAGATAVGGISGGAFNPAVGLGICLAGLMSWKLIWVYLIVCGLGGALAGYAFRALNPDDVEGPAPGATLAKKVPAVRRPSGVCCMKGRPTGL